MDKPLALAGSICALLLLGEAPSPAVAAVIQSGNIVSFSPGVDLRVGQTGSGQLTVNGGSTVNLVANGVEEPFFVLGRLPGSSGQVSIDGAGSAINLLGQGLANNAPSAQVGREGAGSMTITNGGVLSVKSDPNATPAANTLSPNVTVARDATSSGSLTVNNGSVLVEGTGAFFFVGRSGGDGTANFSNGSTLQVKNTMAHPDGAGLTVGRDSGSVGIANFANTQVTIDGGTSAGGIFAGRETGASGSVSFGDPGTTVNVTAGTDAFLTIGRDAGTQGLVLVSGGALMNLTGQRGSIDLGRFAGAAGELQITGGSVVNLSASTIDADVTIGGSFTGKTSAGSGTLLIDGTGSHLNLGNASGGSLHRVIVGAATTLGGISSDGGQLTIQNGGRLTADAVNLGVNGVLDGNGHIGANLSLEGGTIKAGNAPGPMTVQGGFFASSGSIAGGAQVNVSGQSGAISLGSAVSTTGQLQIIGGSTLNLGGALDAQASIGGAFAGQTAAGSGSLLIEGTGSHLNLGNANGGSLHRVIVGAATTLGGVSSDGGHLTVRNGGSLTADIVNLGISGVLDGNGQINAKVSLEGGTIAPGNSPGTMTVDGDLTVSSGVIEVEVSGLGAGQYDVLNVLGGVTFEGGSILFKFIEGFLPKLGDAIDFLNADAVFGLENVLFAYEGAGQGFLFDVFVLGGGGLRFVAENNANAVPEPTSLGLLGLALTGLAVSLRRRHLTCVVKSPRAANVAVAVALLGFASTPVQAADLSADEVNAKIIGKTLKWQSPSAGTRGVTRYEADGTAILSNSNISGISSDRGKWRFDGNKLCVTWKLIRNGQESCFTISAADGGKFKTSTNLEILVD